MEPITTKDIEWESPSIPEIAPVDLEKLEKLAKENPGRVVHVKNPPVLSAEQRKFNQAMQMAITLSKSTIVPVHFRGKPDDVFACIMLGSELGFKPMMSLNSIVMIQGSATLKAQTMLATVKARCPKAIIKITVDEVLKKVIVEAKRDVDDTGYIATWDMDKAKLMMLTTKDNWVKQPMTMLRWRAVSEALRIVFADILMGIYSAEEMMDMSEPKTTDKDKAKEATAVFSSEEE